MKVSPLPQFPSVKGRKALPPSQLALLRQNILVALDQVLSQPISTHTVTSSLAFVSSYARDHAAGVLESLIWESEPKSQYGPKLEQVDQEIHRKTFLLAERISFSLDFQTLLDLSVVYGSKNPKRIRALFDTAFNKNPVLIGQVQKEVAPSFIELLQFSQTGLYGLRKLSHLILSALRPSPPACIGSFTRIIPFIVSIAHVYQHDLTNISQSYGGFHSQSSSFDAPLDDWQRIILDTKVALLDSFHILISHIFSDVVASQGNHPDLAAAENAFDVIFALLDLPPPESQGLPPTAFLNQSLLSDYQHAYEMSQTIAKTLQAANSERALLLSSTLESLDATSHEDAGALKFLIHSSGAAPGIDVVGNRQKPPYAGGKGKGKAKAMLPAPEDDPALDVAVSQVLDVFPDQDPHYLRHLLAYPDYSFKGNAERLIEALLEGTAPSPEDAAATQLTQSDGSQSPPIEDEYQFTQDRRNIFDDEEMDLSRVRTGKKVESSSDFLQDRAFMSEMKSSILQRAEAAAYDFDDDDDQPHYSAQKGRDVAFEDDEDGIDEGSVVYVRDGDESQEGNSDDDSEEDRAKERETAKDPTTILELAYLRDPKLFANDAQTRRSKERADLKAQTGWSDEQIQGWKVMLERNPHKDRILQKHEFSGNQRGMVVNPIPSGSQSQDNRGRGRGRGRGNRGQDRGRGGGGRGGGDRGRGGGGRGRGGGHHGEGGPSDEAPRERAWKDKNKARQANHDRKRGHDKKMSRMGGPS